MSIWFAALQGLVQGLTEFLPVSSSGHLVLVQALFGSGVETNYMLFNVLRCCRILEGYQGTVCRVFRLDPGRVSDQRPSVPPFYRDAADHAGSDVSHPAH